MSTSRGTGNAESSVTQDLLLLRRDGVAEIGYPISRSPEIETLDQRPPRVRTLRSNAPDHAPRPHITETTARTVPDGLENCIVDVEPTAFAETLGDHSARDRTAGFAKQIQRRTLKLALCCRVSWRQAHRFRTGSVGTKQPQCDIQCIEAGDECLYLGPRSLKPRC